MISDLFTLNELIIVCDILNIPIEGEKTEVAKRIIYGLCDLSKLAEFAMTNVSEDESLGLPAPNKHEKINKKDCSVQCIGESILSDDCVIQCNLNKNNYVASGEIYDSNRKNSVINNVGNRYADIESTILKFDGDKHENVNRWIEHFEDISNVFWFVGLAEICFR